jgi:hypothetical protein
LTNRCKLTLRNRQEGYASEEDRHRHSSRRGFPEANLREVDMFFKYSYEIEGLASQLPEKEMLASSGRDPERSRRGEPAAEILSEANGSRKSLIYKYFTISPLNLKILREFLPNPMIPIARG